MPTLFPSSSARSVPVNFETDQHSVARELATALSSLKALGITDRKVYSDILKATLEQHPKFWGVWTVWKPDALDGRDRDFANREGHDETGRYVPLWKRTESGLRLEPNVGYDEPGVGDYYFIPIRKKHEVTLSPYVYRPADGVKRVITSQVAPIFYQGTCLGVAGFDILASRSDSKSASLNPQEAVQGSRGGNTLSNRETEVLSWVSKGKSNGDIAVILGISAHTVKHHMEKIFTKLGVENRHAAMLCALQPYLGNNEG